MRIRTRLSIAAVTVAFAAAGSSWAAFGTTAAASASPGTSCAPSVPCLIAQLQCDNKLCHG